MSEGVFSEWAGRRFLLFFALLFFLQGFFGNFEKSLTMDEPVFIVAGYTYLIRNDFRLNREAPPLLQQLMALPLLAMDLKLPSVDSPAWQRGDHFEFARHFFLLNSDKTRLIGFWARLPTLLLGAGLILVVGFWGMRLYGPLAGLAGAAVAALSPNLLAHAKVATTDIGCTFFMFLALYLFWRAVHGNSVKNWLLCGLFSGLALLAKYTALLLGPIYLLLAAGLLLRRPRPLGVSALVRGLLIVGGLCLLLVSVGYTSLNPLHYFRGMQNVYSNLNSGYHYYLLGNFSTAPWWYYNLLAFVIKVPIPILLLLLLALFSLRRDQQSPDSLLFLLLPAGVIIGVCLFDRANFGIRRILPAFPFLFLFVGQYFAVRAGKIKTWLGVILFAWLTLDAALIFPHHLAHFNGLVGGPERGPYLMNDSNIDWGQDLPGLAVWQEQHPEAVPMKFFYYGFLMPQFYGVQAEMVGWQQLLKPQSGTYAVSAHNLTMLRKLQHLHGYDIDWLSKYQPIDRIGYSIYIYRLP